MEHPSNIVSDEMVKFISPKGLTLCILETPKRVLLQDEMQHKAAFHQGLHCLLRLKQPSS